MNKPIKLEELNTLDIIYKYTKEKLSCRKIAKLYNLSPSFIHKILRKLNVTPNNNSQYRRKYFLNEYFLDVIDAEEKAYFLGFFYADGCNSPERKVLKMSLQERDREILEKFSKMFEFTGPIRLQIIKRPNCQNQVSWSFCSQRLSERITELGCPKS